MNLLIDDGSLAVARQRAPTKTAFPFCNLPTPDRFARLSTRPMVIRPQYFLPITVRRTDWRNVLIFSDAFGDGSWEKNRCMVGQPGLLAPDNSLAWKVTEDATVGDSHMIQQTGIAFVAPGTVARYIIAKADTRTRLELSVVGDVAIARGFDLIEGLTFPNTVGMAEPDRCGMFPLDDGWWFCWMTQPFLTGLLATTWLNDGTSAVYTGDGTSGLFIAYDHVVLAGRTGPIFKTDATARTISAPDIDVGDALRNYDPFSFLLEESEPATDNVGRYVWDRVYGRIPTRQVVPATLVISKPAVPGTGDLPRIVGDYFARQQFLPNVWDAYFRVTVSSESGIPAFYPTAGTYQLNYNGDVTGPLNFDATNTDVETELNALPSIIAMGGVTVTGSYNDPSGFIVTWNAYATATFDVSTLTAPTGITITANAIPSVAGFVQLVEITPQQDSCAASAADSFGPAGATPMTLNQNAVNTIDVYLGNYLNSTPATSGTFTLTLWGDTTGALNWNDSMATILAAINGLAAVAARGSYTATNIGPIHGVPVYRFDFTFPAITGGTYKVILFGQTSGAIPYNATLADITTELNLLSEVTARGGVIASEYHPLGSVDPGAGNAYNGRQIFFKLQFGNQAFTADATGLTPSTVIGIFNGDGGIRQVQVITFKSPGTRVLNIPGHPIQTGEECFIPVGAAPGFVIDGSRVTRVDANTVSFTVQATDPDATFTPIIEFDPLTKRGYKPGAASVAASRTTDFYLPGVTIGVETINDIPIPPSESDTDSFLQRAFSGIGDINWQVGELTQWKGPIVSLAKTTIRASTV